ncbi:DUF5689 domain-containing protein [Flavobacterium sp.]|uniref:DUF5689 domain-containing protein n=1 Tax=Flavobacterium sp. TaxID=239 RepID=UPI00391893BD
MKNLKLLLTGVIFAALTGCASDDYYDIPDLSNECVTIAKTKEVTDITNIATASAAQYTTDDNVTDYIEAYVTSSDEGGNFYKSISMMSLDGLKGFSMPVDNYNLFNEFEPGRKVTIKLDKKRYFNLQHSSTVIGSSYNNGVGRISGVEYKNVIFRSCDRVENEDQIVKNLTIAQAKSNQYLNMLIEFDAVQFTDASLGKKYYDATLNSIGGATNHEIVDEAGTKIIVRVSEYAKFAGEAVPSKNGKVRGVLTKFNNDFQFMIRTVNDVKLTNNRIVPFYEESFTSNFPIWTKFSVVGTQVWTLDPTFGNPGACARISGFSTINNANDDWLISPAINTAGLSSGTLSFDNASRFAGNLLEVYISTNYTSGNAPSTATWTLLTGATLDTNINAYVWTNSGGLNISSYLGANIHVAFRYTSTTTASRTWEVDNVKIVGN